MTYCLGISVKEGLVFVSDSRTNAGADNINTYSKMHLYTHERKFVVLLASGNLATTQGVLAQIERDIRDRSQASLWNMLSLDAAAEYVGSISVEEQNKHARNRAETDFQPAASFILGGQIAPEEPRLLQIYPEGNFIRASETMPFLQVGEVKYGRPILDRIVDDETSLRSAVMCGLVSMDSTMRSNVTVGPPIEYLVYLRDTYQTALHRCLEEDDEYLINLRRTWASNLRNAFETLREAPGLNELHEEANIDILHR